MMDFETAINQVHTHLKTELHTAKNSRLPAPAVVLQMKAWLAAFETVLESHRRLEDLRK